MDSRYTLALFVYGLGATLALASLVGCQSTTDILNATQAAAVDTALKRARFEMACPAATGSVLSRKPIDPAIAMTRFTMGGPERYEYTVGVEGCGKRETAVVICTEGSSECFSKYGFLGKVYGLADFVPPSPESLARLRAILDEAFGLTGQVARQAEGV